MDSEPLLAVIKNDLIITGCDFFKTICDFAFSTKKQHIQQYKDIPTKFYLCEEGNSSIKLVANPLLIRDRGVKSRYLATLT